jgi:hypothetical protein
MPSRSGCRLPRWAVHRGFTTRSRFVSARGAISEIFTSAYLPPLALRLHPSEPVRSSACPVWGSTVGPRTLRLAIRLGLPTAGGLGFDDPERGRRQVGDSPSKPSLLGRLLPRTMAKRQQPVSQAPSAPALYPTALEALELGTPSTVRAAAKPTSVGLISGSEFRIGAT